MIVERGSYKLDAFLRKLSKHLTLSESVRWSSGEGVFYLGGGYWRAQPLDKHGVPVDPDEEDQVKITSFKLINPDRRPEEINIIAHAMNILV